MASSWYRSIALAQCGYKYGSSGYYVKCVMRLGTEEVQCFTTSNERSVIGYKDGFSLHGMAGGISILDLTSQLAPDKFPYIGLQSKLQELGCLEVR